jgi:hypothetical protein
MIAAFLLPFPFRGYPAPYLWVYYRLLTTFREPILFITGRDYVQAPEHWSARGRWEMQAYSGQRLGYRIPSETEMAHHRYRFLADALFETLLAESGGNPVAAFRRLLSERIHGLETAFAEALAATGRHDIEAVLTWCNCPSLTAAAARLGIPVLHLEMGPLRWPHYRPTAYLDFRGVNGNTEAEARYLAAAPRFGDGVTVERLRAFFHAGPLPEASRQHGTGVALQVEDDSNLVAFGHGYDNQSLLVRAHLDHADGDVLVRPHPGSLFALKPDWYRLDDSADAIGFVRRCRRILTINSSVGLEALLMGTPVDVLGDCSYRHLAEAGDPAEATARLAHYLFAYLVPMDLIYDPAYLRFRLARPAEAAIVARHLAAYGVAPADPADDLAGLVERALVNVAPAGSA